MPPHPKPSPKKKSSKAKGSKLERKVAKMVGGKRAPLSGAVGGGDVWGHDRLLIECKKRKKMSWSTVRDGLQQAERESKPPRVPVVVTEEDYQRRPLACLYLDDFISLLDEAGPEGARHIRDMARKIKRLASELEEAC